MKGQREDAVREPGSGDPPDATPAGTRCGHPASTPVRSVCGLCRASQTAGQEPPGRADLEERGPPGPLAQPPTPGTRLGRPSAGYRATRPPPGAAEAPGSRTTRSRQWTIRGPPDGGSVTAQGRAPYTPYTPRSDTARGTRASESAGSWAGRDTPRASEAPEPRPPRCLSCRTRRPIRRHSGAERPVPRGSHLFLFRGRECAGGGTETETERIPSRPHTQHRAPCRARSRDPAIRPEPKVRVRHSSQ